MKINFKQNKAGVYITPCPFNLSKFGVPDMQDVHVGDDKCRHCRYFEIVSVKHVECNYIK